MEGPYTLLDMKGETSTVPLPPPSGPSHFQSTGVKRFISNKSSEGQELQSRSNQIVPVSMTLTIYTDIGTESNVFSSDKRISAKLENKDSCHTVL